MLQFELDIEPRLKPSLIGGGVRGEGATERGGAGVNDSQDMSFSQTTKGTQPLLDSVSELEMMTRAGKPSTSTPLFPNLLFATFSKTRTPKYICWNVFYIILVRTIEINNSQSCSHTVLYTV